MGLVEIFELNAAAVSSTEASPAAAAEHLAAPEGWQKKMAVGKGGTPRRRDVVFIAPNGDEIKTIKQLERYLKANPGGPLLSEFDWSTGGTRRRSERLSSKSRLSTDSMEGEQSAKRTKKETPQEDPTDDQITEEKNEVEKSPVAPAEEAVHEDGEPITESLPNVKNLGEDAVVKATDNENNHVLVKEAQVAVDGVENINGDITDEHSVRREEHAEPVREICHGKPEVVSCLTVTKLQEAHTAEVGVRT